MTNRCTLIACAASTCLFLAMPEAHAATITLDFDTAATGLNIVSVPLVTSLGTITASGSIQVLDVASLDDAEFAAAGASGNDIESTDSLYAVLSFDFDVSQVSFVYGGNIGSITVELLDASNAVIATFFQLDTYIGQPAGPVALAASGIRAMRWVDDGAGNFAALDNIEITATAAPEPAALLLLGAGLGAAAARRRSHDRT